MADKNPVDEIIAGGVVGHAIVNKGILPRVNDQLKKMDLHRDYGQNAQKSSNNVEDQLHNIEKINIENI